MLVKIFETARKRKERSVLFFVVQGQHRVVSLCVFKYRKFWYSVPRMLPLFRSLTLFLASSGSRWPRRGQRPTRLCGSFSGQTKPGSQSLTHRKSVRTIKVTLDRSSSWEEDLRRLRHLEVVVDEEGAAVQWGTQVERWWCCCDTADRSA